MVWGDRPDDLGPADLATAAELHPAADGLEHHVARVEHVALVAVVERQGAEGPLHDHLAKPHRAGLEGNVGDPVHSHARRYLQPQAGVTGNGQEALANRAHIGS